MKKFIVALFLGLMAFTAEAQDVKSILTSGKWFIESIQEKGEEPEMSINKTDEWLAFSEDGKVEENHFGDSKMFSWTYDNDKKMIKLSGSETIFHRVIEVSDDKLIVELIEDLENADDNLMITFIK
ncbi:lipocalin-like domain-containing protein [Tenacibaculum agarivorans]|uniref:lipocalin family protein n=1 Tax=Tenacibaculum agarivorans TaxID=1908389 RepID=UPI00094B900C|nr:lipocalin family protein [Tenacibaculum agarivorans]